MRPEIKLGNVAKDTISDFTGVVTCISEWLNGCKRITISPRELHDGKPISNCTFDAEQVAFVESRPLAAPTPTGGPSIVPARPADPVR